MGSLKSNYVVAFEILPGTATNSTRFLQPGQKNPFKALGIDQVKIAVIPSNTNLSCHFEVVGLVHCEGKNVSKTLYRI